MAKAQSDLKFRKASKHSKPYKLADRDGLYLYVSTTGAKSWRFDFRHGGRRQTLTIGLFPDVPLLQARGELDKARSALARNENPATLKQREKQESRAGDTFRALGESWFKDVVMTRSTSWQAQARRELNRAYPYIGTTKIKEVGAADVLGMLRAVEKMTSSHAAEYLRKVTSLVFDYAIQNLRADGNPARSFRKTIERPKVKGHPHIAAKEIPAFLKSVESDGATPGTKLATRLLILLFVRKTELIKSKWPEFDLERAQWEIPGERMKNGVPHTVPLPHQAVKCLKQLEALAGISEFVFPKYGDPKKAMGQSTLNTLFHRVGYIDKFTPHGCRATASTALNEAGYRHDVIERQLSHIEEDDVRRAYNRADYMAERATMMQEWANLIDEMAKPESKVIPGRFAKVA